MILLNRYFNYYAYKSWSGLKKSSFFKPIDLSWAESMSESMSWALSCSMCFNKCNSWSSSRTFSCCNSSYQFRSY